jgi:hypothetical protein
MTIGDAMANSDKVGVYKHFYQKSTEILFEEISRRLG